MAFRKRNYIDKGLARMRAARISNIESGPAPEYPAELPELRRRVIIIDYDFGKRVYRLELFRTNRVDCYRAEANGRLWRDRVGWSKVLEGIRKSFVRVGARNDEKIR